MLTYLIYSADTNEIFYKNSIYSQEVENGFYRVDNNQLLLIMKTIEKNHHLKVIPKNQLETIIGGLVLTASKKINYCPECGTPLSDEDIIESGTNYFKYRCPNCGSKGIINK